jgi:DNA-binding NarL/FixJ family response regulator
LLRAVTEHQARCVRASHNAEACDLWDDHAVCRTVLIVDDHDDFRSAASALLEAEGFTVVACVADGTSAVDAVERLRPEVVLLDIELPDLDGFAVAKRLAAGAVRPRVVLISGRDVAAYRQRLDGVGACGFLAKRELSGAALAALVG